MNLKKWSGSVTCCYGFVFDISQNVDAKRKEKKTQNCHHKLIPTFKNTVASVTKLFDVFTIASNPTFLRPSKIASLKFLFPIFHG